MTDELCAREGCGAPKAWHSYQTTLIGLEDGWALYEGRPENHCYTRVPGRDGICVGYHCDCLAYLAPEPECKAYVFESSVATRMPSGEWALPSGYVVTPLDEYLAAHTLARCLCGHIKGMHVRAKCIGNWKWITKTGIPVSRPCHCKKFEAQP